MDFRPASWDRHVRGYQRRRLPILFLLILGCASCGGSDDSSVDSGDSGDSGDPPSTSLPAAPTELRAGPVTDTSITLRWNDNADNETGFEIERRLQTGTVDDYERIGTTGANTNSYADTVEPETAYLYRVRATSSAGSSDYTAELAVSSLVPPVLGPSDLTILAVTGASVDLSWTDNADNETEYRVERRDAATAYAVIATLAADSTSYLDDDVSSGTTYTYRVQATSPKTVSSYSNEAQATTASAPARTDVFARLQSTSLGSRARDVMQTEDGGYLFVGYLDVDDSLVEDDYLLVVKLDPTGAVDWTRGFDAPSSQDDHAFAVEATPDGGYIVTGVVNTMSDVWVLKLDASGDLEWESAYGAGADRFGYAVTTVDGDADGVPDDGYLVVGSARVPRDAALAIRLDPLGNVLWQRTYDVAVGSTAYSVRQTAAGNFIIAGELYPEPFRSSFWVMKLDPAGGTIWQRSYALLGAGEEGIAKALSVRQVDDDDDGAADDGFIVAGYADILPTSAFSYDVWVLRLTTDGDIVWQKRYGVPNLEEIVADAEVDSDGNLVVAGTAMGDLLLLKIDGNGDLLIQRTYGGISADAAEAIDATADGGVVLLGDVAFEVGRRDGWILKLDASTDIQFVPGKNFQSTDLSFVGIDTATAPVDTTVMPFTDVDAGQPMTPAVIEPTIIVSTQSQ